MTDTQQNRGGETVRSLHDGKVIYSPTTHVLETGVKWPVIKGYAKTPYVLPIEPTPLTRKRSSDWSWIEPIAVTSVESSMLIEPTDQLALLKKQIGKNYRKLQASDRSIRKTQKAMRKILKARLTELQKTTPKPSAKEIAKPTPEALKPTDRLQFP